MDSNSKRIYKAGDDVNGKYEIAEFIGAGTYGQVYRCKDTAIGRDVAIKFLTTNRHETDFSRFKHEADAIARIGHPNVITLFDFNETPSGTPFIVMEHMQGETLRAYIDEKSLTVNESVSIMKSILEGLKAAHKHEIVHRDLKPSNVFLRTIDGDDRPQVTLFDFGLAKRLNASSGNQLTSENTIIGTPHFCSPEQTRGENVTEVSDIWACGIILYRLLTGKLPFKATSASEVYTCIQRDNPPDMQRLRPDVPGWIIDVVLRCLSKDPEDRYQNAEELIEALETERAVGKKGQLGARRLQYRVILPASLGIILTVTAVAFVLNSLQKPKVSDQERDENAFVRSPQIQIQSNEKGASENGKDGSAVLNSDLGEPQKKTEFESGCRNSPTGKGGSMCLIPEGHFQMGCDVNKGQKCSGDEHPIRKIFLDAFLLDKSEVTVSEYIECMRASKRGCTPPENNNAECNFGEKGNKRTHPVNCVSWKQAKRYCQWAGKRLPTEAEWEKAARGTDRERYPWPGTDMTCEHALYRECKGQGTSPICKRRRGDSTFGVCDMMGNVEEWVEDRHDPAGYNNRDLTNPKGPSRGDKRVTRGGSWFSNRESLSVTDRKPYWPHEPTAEIGFRCAMDLEQKARGNLRSDI